MAIRLTDDVERNLEIISDLLTELPPPARNKVRAVAAAVNDVVQRIAKDYPKDPIAALGVAYAVNYIAQRMAQNSQEGAEQPLIQLLS